MAKTKPSVPVQSPGKGAKGGRAGSKTPTTTTTPRRSTRKTTQSAKQQEAFAAAVGLSKVGGKRGKASPVKEETAGGTNVSKRASPAKAAASKIVKKRTSAKTLRGSAKKSPAKAATPSPATKSPVRGKPKAPSEPPASATSKKPRGRPRKDAATTSPATTSADDGGMAAVANARAKEQAAAASNSKAQPLKPSAGGVWTDSPTKKASPAKRTRSRRSKNCSGDDDYEEDVDVKRQRVKSARVRQASVGGIRKSIEPKSPSKAASKSPARKVRGAAVSRAKAPTKAALHRASRTSLTSPAKTKSPSPSKNAAASPSRKSSAISTRTRSRSPADKSTSGATIGTDITVPKTRSSRSPSKPRQQETARSRSHSPVKGAKQSGPNRRSSAPSSPVRTRSQSPAKPSRSPTRKPCARATFEERYLGHDEYGEALRTIERAAFEDPHLRPFSNDDIAELDLVEDHVRRARERGIERAETQAAFRCLADNSEQCLTGGARLRPGRALKKTGGRSVSANRSRSRAPTEEDDNDFIRDVSSQQSPLKRNVRRAIESPQRRLAHSQSPKSARSTATPDNLVPLPEGEPSAPGRGAIRTATNPEFIPGTHRKKKNSFFETMPGPEVWHRRMPSFLPFGETPFMEREMSRQISQDLAQGNEPTVRPGSAAGGVFNTFRNLFKGRAATDEQSRASPWELPEVSEVDVQKLVEENERRAASNTGSGGVKRKASDSAKPSSPERPRR